MPGLTEQQIRQIAVVYSEKDGDWSKVVEFMEKELGLGESVFLANLQVIQDRSDRYNNIQADWIMGEIS